jgi:chemotaxis signal transduction protein
MTEALSSLAERAAGLRSAFDRAFAAPVRADMTVKQDLLAIRVGVEPCAVRLSEVTGLFVDRRITRIPTNEAALLGIASFRGAIVPVYSLRALLGHAATQTPRWLVIAADAPVALAFDLFEGHLRVPVDAILPQQAKAQMRGFAPEFVRDADLVRPILHLASIIAGLGAAAPSAAAS